MIIDAKLQEVLDALMSLGARPYFVGGCVRDYLLGRESKDYDIEVFNIDSSLLEETLNRFGTCDLIGKKFGIYKLYCLPDVDFALPRKEVKNAAGHQGFDIEVDPYLDLQKASRRRDFTMNAIYYDIKNKEIIDLNHGVEDIKYKVIRVVCPDTFIEDPLRVLRMAQFISRFGFEADLKSKKLCHDMVLNKELETLSNERILHEYEKLLLGDYPSLGLQFLLEIEALPAVLKDLQGVYQRPDYHPEGDALVHTFMVVDNAALFKPYVSNPLYFMWAALLHDVGKKETSDQFGHAYNHEHVGASKAVDFLRSIQKNKKLEDYVYVMIKNHMKLMTYQANGCKDKTFLRLLSTLEHKATIEDLYYLTLSDMLGTTIDRKEQVDKLTNFYATYTARLGDRAPAPIVSGHDLIELGYKPGIEIKELLDKAYDLQLGGMSKQGILKTLSGKKG